MVNWKELGEFAKVQKVKNKNHITENAYSITQSGLVPTSSFFKEKTKVTSSDTTGYYIVQKDWFVYSPSRIDVGSISFLKDEGPVIVSPIDVVFSVDMEVCLPDYLLSYLLTHEGINKMLRRREGVEGMGRRNLPFSAIQSITIPTPSLAEQKRIVVILSVFTESIDNLKQRIATRRKQYEYYRDKLLDLEGKEGVVMKELQSELKVLRGKRLTKNQLNEEAIYPVYHGGLEPLGNYNQYNRDENTVMVINVGASAGTVGFCDKKFWSSDGCFCISHSESIIDKFLYYYLQTKTHFLQSQVRYAGIPTLDNSVIERMKVPFVSLNEQRRIVSILNTFEESIQILEKQLKLREKQYEYYRNKLLTFE